MKRLLSVCAALALCVGAFADGPTLPQGAVSLDFSPSATQKWGNTTYDATTKKLTFPGDYGAYGPAYWNAPLDATKIKSITISVAEDFKGKIQVDYEQIEADEPLTNDDGTSKLDQWGNQEYKTKAPTDVYSTWNGTNGDKEGCPDGQKAKIFTIELTRASADVRKIKCITLQNAECEKDDAEKAVPQVVTIESFYYLPLQTTSDDGDTRDEVNLPDGAVSMDFSPSATQKWGNTTYDATTKKLTFPGDYGAYGPAYWNEPLDATNIKSITISVAEDFKGKIQVDYEQIEADEPLTNDDGTPKLDQWGNQEYKTKAPMDVYSTWDGTNGDKEGCPDGQKTKIFTIELTRASADVRKIKCITLQNAECEKDDAEKAVPQVVTIESFYYLPLQAAAAAKKSTTITFEGGSATAGAAVSGAVVKDADGNEVTGATVTYSPATFPAATDAAQSVEVTASYAGDDTYEASEKKATFTIAAQTAVQPSEKALKVVAANAEVVATTTYDITGKQAAPGAKGLLIVVERNADGSSSAHKVVVK